MPADTYTGSPGNSLPNGAFSQIAAVDPVGGGATVFSITNLAATTFGGGAATDFVEDITISGAGVISASNLNDNRIYEVTVQVVQGSATFAEVNFDKILDFNANTADTIGLDNDIFIAFGTTTGTLNAANFNSAPTKPDLLSDDHGSIPIAFSGPASSNV